MMKLIVRKATSQEANDFYSQPAEIVVKKYPYILFFEHREVEAGEAEDGPDLFVETELDRDPQVIKEEGNEGGAGI